MFCPECGHDVSDEARFCPNCGKDLTAKREAQEEAAAEEEAAAPPSAVHETAEPAAPTPPEPAVPSEPPPSPASYETAREGAAEEMTRTSAEESAYQPYSPTPVPQPTSGTPEQPAPPLVPEAMPAGPSQGPEQQPGEVPPGQQPPPPVVPGEAAPPPAEKKTNWGPICLIGCGIMLLLTIVIGVGLYFLGRSASESLNQISVPPNTIDIGQPDSDAAPTDGPEAVEPGDEDGLGELIGRLGEAVEGAGAAISAANVKGFDPSTVDTAMLPTFYGFMIALAEDDPQAMHKWMSPELKQEWSPDNWTVSPHIEHLDYELVDKSTLDDGTVRFVIEETIQDNEANEEQVLSWEIHFEQIDGEWFVTYLE